MPNIVLDASSLVGALLKVGSVPERALLHARSHASICLSRAVEQEIRAVFSRPKFGRYVTPERTERILELIIGAAVWIEPTVAVTDCRDPTDNRYLELAVAAHADTIVASDDDLLVLHPWRGIPIVTPAAYLSRFRPG